MTALRYSCTIAAAILILCAPATFGQANGNLQLHFMDVGQGDGCLLISPKGETVLFDDGTSADCSKPVEYLKKLNLTKIDYHIASHYHSDHIGCASQVFEAFPLVKAALDRGGSYSTAAYRKYLEAVGSKREAATEGQIITLDADSENPVTIKIVALNGNGITTANENDLSVVAVVKFGDFDAVIGGDLSGFKTGNYEDIESSVAPKVGQVELYKVHHHCSGRQAEGRYTLQYGSFISSCRPGGSLEEQLHNGNQSFLSFLIGSLTDPVKVSCLGLPG